MRNAGGRVAQRWRWALAYLRGAPATLVYTFTLVVTWYSAAGAAPGLEHRLLLSESTNLQNMLDQPLRVLVASAFWIESPVFPVLTTGGLLAVMVPAERALGTRRWVTVFALGHVLASVLTVTGIALALQAGLVSPRITSATDVGVSYGAAAVAGCAAHLLPRAWARRGALVVLVAGLGTFVVVDHTFTDVGHLVALGVGLAAWPAVRAWLRRTGPPVVPAPAVPVPAAVLVVPAPRPVAAPRPVPDRTDAAPDRTVAAPDAASSQVAVEEPQDAAPGVLR